MWNCNSVLFFLLGRSAYHRYMYLLNKLASFLSEEICLAVDYYFISRWLTWGARTRETVPAGLWIYSWASRLRNPFAIVKAARILGRNHYFGKITCSRKANMDQRRNRGLNYTSNRWTLVGRRCAFIGPELESCPEFTTAPRPNVVNIRSCTSLESVCERAHWQTPLSV